MSAETFVDTNVLVRLYDRYQTAKRVRAAARLAAERRDGLPTISPAILGELYLALVRPVRGRDGRVIRRSWQHTRKRLVRSEKAAALRVVIVQRGTMLEALRLRAEYQLAWWDSVHLATAKEHGCTRMLTEDVPSQPVIEGVVYENPFAVP
jgi:predicted nucleic acid-binding protein